MFEEVQIREFPKTMLNLATNTLNLREYSESGGYHESPLTDNTPYKLFQLLGKYFDKKGQELHLTKKELPFGQKLLSAMNALWELVEDPADLEKNLAALSEEERDRIYDHPLAQNSELLP